MCYYKPNKSPCTCSFLQLIQPCSQVQLYASPIPSQNSAPLIQVCANRYIARGVGQRICQRCDGGNHQIHNNPEVVAAAATTANATYNASAVNTGGGRGEMEMSRGTNTSASTRTCTVTPRDADTIVPYLKRKEPQRVKRNINGIWEVDNGSGMDEWIDERSSRRKRSRRSPAPAPGPSSTSSSTSSSPSFPLSSTSSVTQARAATTTAAAAATATGRGGEISPTSTSISASASTATTTTIFASASTPALTPVAMIPSSIQTAKIEMKASATHTTAGEVTQQPTINVTLPQTPTEQEVHFTNASQKPLTHLLSPQSIMLGEQLKRALAGIPTEAGDNAGLSENIGYGGDKDNIGEGEEGEREGEETKMKDLNLIKAEPTIGLGVCTGRETRNVKV